MIKNNYGHWWVSKDVDISDYLGFVYLIKFEDGTKYIGAKKIWKKIKAPPSSFKRKTNFEQSDWKTYQSSSSEVINKIKEPKKLVILGWYKTWGQTLYAEAMFQLKYNVLSNEDWLNSQIEGHFTKSCISETLPQDLIECDKILNGFSLYRISEKIELLKDDKLIVYNLSDNELSNLTIFKLISGLIDQYKNFKLPDSRRINKFKYLPTGEEFLNSAQVELKFNTSYRELLKTQQLIKLTIESKEDYIKRLRFKELIKTTLETTCL